MKYWGHTLLLLYMSLVARAQQKPIFDRGKHTFSSFVQQQLKYPTFSKNNCIQGTVWVGFRLNRQGKIDTVNIQKGTNTDLDDEAIRLVYLTDQKWTVSESYDTTQTLLVPIQFSLASESCRSVSKSKIEDAKNNYLIQQSVIQTIQHFYKAKLSGEKISGRDEIKIETLKDTLGINEEYAQSLLREAQEDLKKGDMYSAKKKAFQIRYFGYDMADSFISNQGW